MKKPLKIIVRLLFILMMIMSSFRAQAQTSSVFSVDTMTYSINLDITENNYLRQLPEDILKGYFRGRFHAYYPGREMNEVLIDDFLSHFAKAEFVCGNNFCWDEYVDHSYLKELFNKFRHEIRYREVMYYDEKKSVVKREVIWLQLMYTDLDMQGQWKTINGPKFWMSELNTDTLIHVPNRYNAAKPFTIRQEFDARHFVPNEIGKEKLPEKSQKMDDVNEN